MSQPPHPSVSGLIGYITGCPSSLISPCLSSLVTSQAVPAPSSLRVCHHWLDHRISQLPHPSVSVIVGYITGCHSPLTPLCLPSLVTSQDVQAPSPLRVCHHWLHHRLSQAPHFSMSAIIGYITGCLSPPSVSAIIGYITGCPSSPFLLCSDGA